MRPFKKASTITEETYWYSGVVRWKCVNGAARTGEDAWKISTRGSMNKFAICKHRVRTCVILNRNVETEKSMRRLCTFTETSFWFIRRLLKTGRDPQPISDSPWRFSPCSFHRNIPPPVLVEPPESSVPREWYRKKGRPVLSVMIDPSASKDESRDTRTHLDGTRSPAFVPTFGPCSSTKRATASRDKETSASSPNVTFRPRDRSIDDLSRVSTLWTSIFQPRKLNKTRTRWNE